MAAKMSSGAQAAAAFLSITRAAPMRMFLVRDGLDSPFINMSHVMSGA